MPRLVLGKGFLSTYGNLPKDVQKKVDKSLAMFREHTGAGINLEKPEAIADERARTMRVDKFWRGVVAALGGPHDTYVLVDVLAHDEAYGWCQRHRFDVNPATGALQIQDVTALEGMTTGERLMEDGKTGLLVNIPDKHFTQLGIPDHVIPLVRTIDTEEELEALAFLLPQGQADALLGLAAGIAPERIYAELIAGEQPGEVDTTDLAAAVERPSSGGMFYVVQDEAALQDVLNKPFDHWRVFLHPSQHRLAYRDVFAGPVKVTGGAGTGKTVVAMHRAKHLADTADAEDHVLLTTFTRNLAANLEATFPYLAGTQSHRVEITNVDALAHQIVREAQGRPPRIETDTDKLWSTAATEAGVADLAPEFLAAEYEQVILGQDIRDRQTYFEAARTGQGVPLNRRGRGRVWKAVEAFEEKLRLAGARTFLQLARDAADHLYEAGARFRHVVIDEAQDLHPQQWRMLRALVPEQANDLFMVGDAHQRIYDRHVSLRRLGIHVVGRSYRLRLNYRTTEEILGWSLSLLRGAEYDDLDDGLDSLVGYRSSLHGPSPEVHGYPHHTDELHSLAANVRDWVDAGVQPDEIGVAARTRKLAEDCGARLAEAGIAVTPLGEDERADPGVGVGTMHRMKGLEFRCVAVVRAEEGTVPLSYALCDPTLDRVQHARDMQRERSLLFVACTRARDVLRVSWSGQPSPFLPADR